MTTSLLLEPQTQSPQRLAPVAADAPKAIVIGAGFGGLAAAMRLRAKGYAVTLLERASMLGGRAHVFEKDGFRHDAGPTVITAHFLFEELFALMGRQFSDYVTLAPLDPWYRFYYDADGTTFDYGGTVEHTLAEIRRVNPDDIEGYKQMLAHSQKLFEVGFDGLADQPFHDAGVMVRQIPKLVRLQSYLTVWQLMTKHFKHEKLRQAFSIQPLLLGGSPFDTTSIYGLIHYLERNWGVYFAMGGTGAIVRAMGRVLEEERVEIRLNSTVDQILVDGKTVRGVRLADGRELKADVVVSNADPMHLYRHMLPKPLVSRSAKMKTRLARVSMGLYLMYFGTRRQYPDVAHHTIWLGKRYKGLLDDIFKRKVLADDFSLYIHRPTATDPSFAPPGCDSYYVLCPVPNMASGIDWAIEGLKLKSRIIAALDRTILTGLAETITADFEMTPADFAENYLSHLGAGFSISPHFSQSAYFRFHNRAEGVDGLFLTGAGTHPGAGVPGVLCSAKVIDRLVPAVAAR